MPSTARVAPFAIPPAPEATALGNPFMISSPRHWDREKRGSRRLPVSSNLSLIVPEESLSAATADLAGTDAMVSPALAPCALRQLQILENDGAGGVDMSVLDSRVQCEIDRSAARLRRAAALLDQIRVEQGDIDVAQVRLHPRGAVRKNY
jgi:hypothetical protein